MLRGVRLIGRQYRGEVFWSDRSRVTVIWRDRVNKALLSFEKVAEAASLDGQLEFSNCLWMFLAAPGIRSGIPQSVDPLDCAIVV